MCVAHHIHHVVEPAGGGLLLQPGERERARRRCRGRPPRRRAGSPRRPRRRPASRSRPPGRRPRPATSRWTAARPECAPRRGTRPPARSRRRAPGRRPSAGRRPSPRSVGRCACRSSVMPAPRGSGEPARHGRRSGRVAQSTLATPLAHLSVARQDGSVSPRDHRASTPPWRHRDHRRRASGHRRGGGHGPGPDQPPARAEVSFDTSPEAVQALDAVGRRRGRHPHAGRRRGRRHRPGLRAEDEQLRPGRGHRAARRRPARSASSTPRPRPWWSPAARTACSAPAPTSRCWPPRRTAGR